MAKSVTEVILQYTKLAPGLKRHERKKKQLFQKAEGLTKHGGK